MTLSATLTSQGRVLHALILREIKTRFGKLKLGYLWAFFEPIMFIAFFALIWSFTGRAPAGMELLPFLLTGFGSFLFFRGLFTFPLQGIRINKTLLTFPQVTPFSIIVARGILEFVTMFVVFLVLLGVTAALGYDTNIEKPLMLLGVLILISLLGLGGGFIFSSLQMIFPSTGELVGTLIMRPAMILSGTFFTAGMFPEPAREWLLYNPLLHGIELARSAFFRGFESPYAEPSYLVWWAVSSVFAGLLLQRALRHKLYQP